MYSFISVNEHNNQAYLAYDGLYPELACKILYALTCDEMCETMQWLDTKLVYAVTGYREDNGKRKWGRDMVLYVDAMEASEEMDEPVEEQLKKDRKELEKVQQFVKSRTGII